MISFLKQIYYSYKYVRGILREGRASENRLRGMLKIPKLRSYANKVNFTLTWSMGYGGKPDEELIKNVSDEEKATLESLIGEVVNHLKFIDKLWEVKEVFCYEDTITRSE